MGKNQMIPFERPVSAEMQPTQAAVIDLWMRWRRCDFATAIGELAEMLL